MNKVLVSLIFNWFLINVLFCLLPLAISSFLANQINDNVVSGFISYAYTLTISSVYLFEKFSRPKNSFRWIGIFMAFLLIVAFIIYPELATDEMKKVVTNYSIRVVGIILILTLIVTFFMNYPSLLLEAREDKVVREFNKARESGGSTDEMIEQLNE